MIQWEVNVGERISQLLNRVSVGAAKGIHDILLLKSQDIARVMSMQPNSRDILKLHDKEG